MGNPERYAGVCIGGPYAGKQLAHHGPYYKIYETMAEPLVYDASVDLVETVDTLIYEFQIMYPGIGIWTVATMDTRAMWHELLDGYMKAKNDEEAP